MASGLGQPDTQYGAKALTRGVPDPANSPGVLNSFVHNEGISVCPGLEEVRTKLVPVINPILDR